MSRDQDYVDAVLSFFLFEGDFGDGSERCLKDKIGMTRKESRCYICDETIIPKSTARLSTWVFDGEIMHYRCCTTCCDAMASSVNGDDDECTLIEGRYEIGETSRMNRSAS
ncbi:hypothetical protein [Xenorhabdus szentirmaii]|uniref:hypothetical protein n=1 Tax=Xenorhabdus szentirmaii TaxID=290112 RepID=UPI0019B794CB|nr:MULTISPECIES: hypothetical protein [unclassified Xenorhabdus]MBD2782286.1 hypothetical protein [Xenorhabdus sp. 38]MBD2806584.1 hypothetical protein [Xenorhabdus sp. ZM]